MSSRSPRRSLIGSYRFSVVIKPNETEFSESLSGVLDLYDGKHVIESLNFTSFSQLAEKIINYWETKLGTEVNVHRFSNWLSEYFSDIGVSNIDFYQLIEAVRSLGKGTSLQSSGVAVREAKVISDDFDPIDPQPAKATGAHMLGELVKPDEEPVKVRPEQPPDDTVVKPSEIFKPEETVSPEVTLLPPVKTEVEVVKEEPPMNTLLKPSEILKKRETAYPLIEVSPEDAHTVTGDPIVTKPIEKVEREEPPTENLLRPSEYLKKRETIEVIFRSSPRHPSHIEDEKKTRILEPSKDVEQKKLAPPSEVPRQPADYLMIKEEIEEEDVSIEKISEEYEEPDIEVPEPKPSVVIDPSVQEIPAPPSTGIVKVEEVKREEPKVSAKGKEILPFEIEILDDGSIEVEFDEYRAKTAAEMKVTEIAGVGEKTAMLLKDEGFDSIEKLSTATPEDLTKVRGIGPSTAKKLISEANAIKADLEQLKKPTLDELQITDIMGVGDKTAMLLKDGGYDSIAKLLETTPEELSKVRGIGVTTAKKLIYGANALKKKTE
jgi:predicted flap endonuclease-1-like 5' DNA nuclease